MEKFRPRLKQLLVIAGFIVLFFLLMDLNSRLNDLTRLNNQLSEMETEVGGLRMTQDELRAQIAFATSEAAVSQYARNSGMIRDGEKLVVPLPAGTPVPAQSMLPTPTPMVVKNLDIWWALFFGD
jgi:cell division protein FtsB